MVIYIPTLMSKYIIITVCDPILHEYYITWTYQNMIYKIFTRCNNWKRLLSWKGISRVRYRRWIWRTIWPDLTLLPGSDPGTCYAPTAHSDWHQKVHQRPSFEIWTCRSKVVWMQPNEYIRIIRCGVRKSKYKCTENRWNYVKTCLCMNGIMFKSYQWKRI